MPKKKDPRLARAGVSGYNKPKRTPNHKTKSHVVVAKQGDKVKTIEGIFSGTLSYIFNTYKPGMKFSDVIADAKEKGFTEPDPRDDLSGTDVARKVTILARACGVEVDLDGVRALGSVVRQPVQDGELEAYDVVLDDGRRVLLADDDASLVRAPPPGTCLLYTSPSPRARG